MLARPQAQGDGMTQVALSEIEQTAKTALERHGAAPWIAAEVARAYNVTNYPTTVLLVDGKVVDAKVGLITHDRLDQMVAAAR